MAENSKIHPFRRFINLLKPERKLVYTIYIYAIFAGLVSLTLPLGIQAIINLITGGQVTTSWILLVILVIIGVVINGILQVRQLTVNEILQQKIFNSASFEFAYRIPRIKLSALNNSYLPELINRFFDTVSIQKGLSKVLIDFSTAFFQIFFGLLLISFYHPFFILFSIFLVILVFFIIRFSFPNGLKTSLKESQYKYETANWLEELARNVETFKMAGESRIPLEKNDENTENYIKARRSHFSILVTQYSLLIVFKAIVTAGLLLIGGILVFEQQMNIGQFVAAEIIIILILNSVEKMIYTIESIYDILTAVEKVAVVTELPLEDLNNEGRETTTAEGLKIKLKDLGLMDKESGHQFLQNINLEIQPGEKICLTGGSNAGKTSILQLLSGWFDSYSGNIMYDDIALSHLNLTKLRNQIGDCMSKEGVFQGTIAENIMVGNHTASFEELQEATKITGLINYLESESQGYHKMLYPGDGVFPKSVKQQILWTRGIVGRKSLILWEDMLGKIPFQEKMKFVEYLTSKSNKKTVVMVSKDLQIIEKCDRAIGMENGKIVQEMKGSEAKNSSWFQEICINRNA
jgi:ABC-type bacteriocin/lantibiotic exporter with double-glycine peptidase domain